VGFQVSNLFCIGSPLSVFLALRGQTGRHIFDNFSPNLFNIFNSSDPVVHACSHVLSDCENSTTTQAYRLEPLMHPSYARVHPLRIHRHDSRNHTPYAEMPPELMQVVRSPAREKPPPAKKDRKSEKQAVVKEPAVLLVAEPSSQPADAENATDLALEAAPPDDHGV